MNHQPFRDWLLSDDELLPDQQQILQEHLHSCESCREIETAWSQVESTIQRTPQVQPAPGFTSRWQSNLAAYQLRRQKIRGWVGIGVTSFFVTCLLVILISQLWILIQSPDAFIVMWLERFVTMISLYFTAQEILSPLNWNISVFSIIGVIFIVGITSFMSVLWLATYRKLSTARRII